MTNKRVWDLIVIGGGAAGLWAAGTAAQRNCATLVLEKNKKAGVKILMSGGTRCNITHDCDIQGIVNAFGEQGRFLKPALYNLPPSQVVATIEQLGVSTKVEPGGKIFPVSDRAIDVRDALVRRLDSAGAELRTGIAVTDVQRESDVWNVSTVDEEFQSAKLLICCGGLSYPGCGTTGDGYAWAKAQGHQLVDTSPALTPLTSQAGWAHELSGLTLPDVEATLLSDGKVDKQFGGRGKVRGGFLWTHFGCSGPVPMNLSRFVGDTRAHELRIDLVPGVDESQLQASFTDPALGKTQIQTALQSMVPRRLASQLLEDVGITEGLTLAEFPKRSRQQLTMRLKQLQLPINGTRGYPKAEVTRGGVKTKEVNPKTMESRVTPGLYFAGEILDIDGPIGGFNFQAAFSTGHTAGLHV